jgi:hypothetical protein
MNCEEVQKCLCDLLDESLDGERSQKVSDHLAACPLCSEEMASLAECRRLVSGLPPVEPPLGFSSRVMAHVRNAARKQSLWERLFSPLGTKIPLQATAVILIAVLAAYIYQNELLQRESGITVQPEKFPGRADETDKLAPTAPARESKAARVPDVANLPVEGFKDSARLREPQPLAKPGEQNKGIPGGQLTPTTPSEDQVGSPATLAPAPLQEKSSAMNEAASPSSEQSPPLREAHPKRVRQPLSQPEKERASRDTAFTKESLQQEEGAAGSSLSSLSSGTVIGAVLPADHELVLRLRESIRDDKNMGDQLASGHAQSEWTSLTLPEEAKNLEQAREQAVQTGRSQTVWVTTAHNEYQLFKNELAELGNIEVESSMSELKSDATGKSSDRLRIKVTILPPSSSGKPPPSEPSGR